VGRTERNKGARGELEIVGLLRDHGWPRARRTHDGREQSQRGDIAEGPGGVYWEVKRQERLNVPAALAQVERDAPALVVPILVHRPSRQAWMTTLPLTDLLPLLSLREAA
jgi:hypothetical protein